MKKLTALMLAMLCLLSFKGCRRAPGDASAGELATLTAEEMEERADMKAVRVLADLPKLSVEDGQLMETLAGLPGYGTEFMLYVESVPDADPDRSNMMARIKTEMMAGKGPDLFLCDQNTYGICGKSYRNVCEPFFTFPERAMKNHMFLPLDEYIENAEYMEWDRFLPVVMEAGRNEEGQQIVPLAYFFPVTIIEKEKYGIGEMECPKTRMEMVQSDNAAVRYASFVRTQDFVGRVMEPGEDEPMFTEEELLEYMEADLDMNRMVMANNDLSEDDTLRQGAFFRKETVWDEEPIFMGLDSPEYSIIPGRNVRDGVTASITAFAAINRNARYPDLAFGIIDWIMKTRNQQKSSLFEERIMCGMPVHMDVGKKELPLDDGWYMNEANFREYEAARSEITEARFQGPADDAVFRIFGATYEELEKSVHEQYVLMEMMLAES